MPRKERPLSPERLTSLQELERERRALLKLDLSGKAMNHRQAEKVWAEARRNANNADIVTSCSWKVG